MNVDLATPLVLAELDRISATLTIEDGQLVIDAPAGLTAELVADCRQVKPMLMWAAVGRATHPTHHWLVCDGCGIPQLLPVAERGRKCRLTPKCPGHVRGFGAVAAPPAATRYTAATEKLPLTSTCSGVAAVAAYREGGASQRATPSMRARQVRRR